ncbi:MAG: Maf family nucleotide pyrophosphatase [Gammaproteobacteria bacterium]|nr:Maf family nucleotide pyrophosphatase [Gammaproteobacteria bacterium]MCF6363842.1 Maf family nucleotide pyrophosphatase [Gammaproteobacteria bacterium]
MPDIYLASSSPRRRELLDQLGVRFAVVVQGVPEDYISGETPEAYVQRLALEKARAGWCCLPVDARCPVLGADTAVIVDDTVLGKPADREAALAMLAMLSGRAHRVLSAVAVVGARVSDATDKGELWQRLGQYRASVRLSESRVWFRRIDGWEYAAYWASGEPADKAGAYAIQGLGGMFVERLDGSYSGVMGLPLFETAELLRACGVQLLPVLEN